LALALGIAVPKLFQQISPRLRNHGHKKPNKHLIRGEKMKTTNHSKTLKCLVAAGVGLLTASTQATDLQLDETFIPLQDYNKAFQYSGNWENITRAMGNAGNGMEIMMFDAVLKNGRLDSGSENLAILDPNKAVSDVLMATWTLNGSDDHFVVTLYSGGGWPSVPDANVPEGTGLTKYMHIGGSQNGPDPSTVNIFVNSPDGDPAIPDGGTTAVLLGAAVSGLTLVRRKLS
jgi:hypothetical protein